MSLPAGGLAHVTSPSGVRRAKSVHVSREMTIPEEGEPMNEALAHLMLQQQMNHQKQQMRLQQQIQLQMSQQQHWQLQQQQQDGMGLDSHKRHMSETDVSRLALDLAQLQMYQQTQAMAASLATSPPPGGYNPAVGSGPVSTLDSTGSTSAANQQPSAQQPMSPLMQALAQQADLQKLSPLGRSSSLRQSLDLGVASRAGSAGGSNAASMGSLAGHLQRQVLLQQLQLQKQMEMEQGDARKQAMELQQAQQQQQRQRQVKQQAQQVGGEELQGRGGGSMEGQWRDGYALNSPSPPKRSPDWSFSAGTPKWHIPAGPPVSSSVSSPPHGR